MCLQNSSVISLHEIFELVHQVIESLYMLLKFMNNFSTLVHIFIVTVISISLGNYYNFILCDSLIFMKSKTKAVLFALIEINNGLTCYNLLKNLLKIDIYFTVFCPSDVLTLTHEVFRKLSHLNSVTQARTRKSLRRVYINFALTRLNALSWMASIS